MIVVHIRAMSELQLLSEKEYDDDKELTRVSK